MTFSRTADAKHVIVDTIHGDVHLTDTERQVIDTAPFQRLRRLSQLGMGQVTYPNATHTRFAHSIGTLAIMSKIVQVAQTQNATEEDEKHLRLAALLHDIGHYPYSHLMEGIDRVRLTEEFVKSNSNPKRSLDVTRIPYPTHVELGALIVT